MRLLVLRLTTRWWYPFIKRVIGQAHEVGTIDSRALHYLCAEFDRTQRPALDRLQDDGYLPLRR